MRSPKLDRIDVNILIELQRDGRITNAQLADADGLSACRPRPASCASSGCSRRASSPATMPGSTSPGSATITVYVEITLVEHRRENFVRFERTLQNFDEVLDCHLISGGYGYLVRMVVPSLTVFQSIMGSLLESNAGISKYFSYIVVNTPICRPEYPIRTLFDDLG